MTNQILVKEAGISVKQGTNDQRKHRLVPRFSVQSLIFLETQNLSAGDGSVLRNAVYPLSRSAMAIT